MQKPGKTIHIYKEHMEIFLFVCTTSYPRLNCLTFFSFTPQISFDRTDLLDLTVPHVRVFLLKYLK